MNLFQNLQILAILFTVPVGIPSLRKIRNLEAFGISLDQSDALLGVMS